MSKEFSVIVPHGEIQAASYRTFLSRLREERDFWSELSVTTPFNNPQYTQVRDFADPVFNRLLDMLRYWGNVVDNLEEIDGRTFSEKFEAIKKDIEEAPHIPPHSASETAKNTMRMFKAGDQENAIAILMGMVFSREPTLYQRNNQQEVIGGYIGFIRGLYAAQIATEFNSQPTIEGFSADKRIAEEIVEELGLALLNKRADIEEQDRWFNEKIEQSTTKVKSKYRELLSGQKSLCGHLEDAENARQTKFDDLLEAFNAHLRLKRPVKLWEERQVEHENSSKSAWTQFVIGSVVLGCVAILAAVFLGETIASGFIKEGCIVGNEPQCNGISPKGPFYISMALLTSSVSIWYLRLQMKLYLSERHLALDARERRAFAETYLSLLKGSDVSSEHEAVILSSLFRPTQDGIISDDAGPDIGLSAIFAKALDRK